MPTARYSQPFPVFGRKGWAFGVGPLFSFPTTSEDRFGSGKWQAGAAGAFVVPRDWKVFFGLTFSYSPDKFIKKQ